MKIAGVQMCSAIRPDDNFALMTPLVEQASRLGARYVLTPEVSVAFAENREGLVHVTGPKQYQYALENAGQLAKACDIFLHIGSLAVALDDGRFANRSILFGPDGEIVASYDKIHLFDATLPGLRDYRESATYRGGDKAVVAKVDDFTLGMTICYDVRFAALFHALAKGGAQLISVPAAFTVPTGQAHWEILLRARAIETGSYVIAAAQGGHHENGRATYGHSMIIDPWGTVLARIEGDAPGVITADIALDHVEQARSRVPALDNAREFAGPVRLG